MPAPKTILTLIENFERNRETYQEGKYNETQVRRDFIDPLFKELGWDMDNSAGYAEAYRDVIHEDAIKIGATTKAPDYCFRIGGQRKFFLEAKKPSVKIKADAEPAFQLRRYAWSAGLPLSIVTDFQEFAIYDCRHKPDKNDKASVCRLFYCTFEEYVDKWDDISSIFSKEAVLKGSFDKYASASKGKKGTTEFDEAFLEEIESWRDLLARNIANRNSGISQRELNYAVQQTIDRVIFLRICEDRGIEPYGQLQALSSGKDVYHRLTQVFRDADDKYNSGLFHFSKEKNRPGDPDELTPFLQIDDKPLKDIFSGLYYPDCPYEFSVISADILGGVYEKFLGKVIRLTAGNRAVIDDKPEVKKAGGVYYTPTYIVEYIVQKTVGTLFADRSIKQADGIRILDPACGSGSFLICAYQYLLDWYLARYLEEGTEKHGKGKAAVIQPAGKGDWRLTTSEKKRILITHVYGVDVDAQAVEVTKLSLLLKVLEGESNESVTSQMKLFHSRVLPDLDKNIRCGNSLVSPDYYTDELELDDETTQRINALDWKVAFPKVFNDGGFDIVIGNPPWGGDIDGITQYIERKYPDSTQGYRDTFKLFIDQGLRLTKSSGLFSYIVPSALMFQPRYIDVRRLLRKKRISILWNVGDGVFGKKVVAPACAFVIVNEPSGKKSVVSILDTAGLKENSDRARVSRSPIYRELAQAAYENTTEETFVTFYRELGKDEVPLGDVLDCKDCGIKHQRVGVGMEQKGKSDLADRLYYEGKQASSTDRHYLIGADLDMRGWRVDFSSKRYFRGNYRKILKKNEIVYFNEDVFNLKEKVVWRQTSDRIRAAVIGEHWFANTLQAGILLDENYDIRYILGLLNSKFINHVYLETVREGGRVFPQVKMSKVRALPFKKLDFNSKLDVSRHERMISLVNKMISSSETVHFAKIPQDRELIQRQLEATSSQIDRLVYEIYELSDSEVKIVELSF